MTSHRLGVEKELSTVPWHRPVAEPQSSVVASKNRTLTVSLETKARVELERNMEGLSWRCDQCTNVVQSFESIVCGECMAMRPSRPVLILNGYEYRLEPILVAKQRSNSDSIVPPIESLLSWLKVLPQNNNMTTPTGTESVRTEMEREMEMELETELDPALHSTDAALRQEARENPRRRRHTTMVESKTIKDVTTIARPNLDGLRYVSIGPTRQQLLQQIDPHNQAPNKRPDDRMIQRVDQDIIQRPPKDKMSCPICSEVVAWSETEALDCTHRFCLDCWTGWINPMTNPVVQGRCLAQGCKRPLTRLLIIRCQSRDSIHTESSWNKCLIERLMMDKTQPVRPCPTLNCQGFILATAHTLKPQEERDLSKTEEKDHHDPRTKENHHHESKSDEKYGKDGNTYGKDGNTEEKHLKTQKSMAGCVSSTACSYCYRYFCGCCLQVEHSNVSCEVAMRWRELVDHVQSGSTQQDLNRLWLESNSRPCPKCQVSIEKAEGCPHMTCEACRFQFCWKCGKDWKSGGHGHCHKSKTVKEEKKQVESSRLKLSEMNRLRAVTSFTSLKLEQIRLLSCEHTLSWSKFFLGIAERFWNAEHMHRFHELPPESLVRWTSWTRFFNQFALQSEPDPDLVTPDQLERMAHQLDRHLYQMRVTTMHDLDSVPRALPIEPSLDIPHSSYQQIKVFTLQWTTDQTPPHTVVVQLHLSTYGLFGAVFALLTAQKPDFRAALQSQKLQVWETKSQTSVDIHRLIRQFWLRVVGEPRRWDLANVIMNWIPAEPKIEERIALWEHQQLETYYLIRFPSFDIRRGSKLIQKNATTFHLRDDSWGVRSISHHR